MSTSPTFPLRFAGKVLCRRDHCGPLGLVLNGSSLGASRDSLLVAFVAHAPVGLPEVLQDAGIEQLGVRQFEISSTAGSWIVEGTAHVHRDATAALASVLPARAVPWHKRIFWRVLLAVAANGTARRLLLKRQAIQPEAGMGS
jgi:hypothetical protein